MKLREPKVKCGRCGEGFRYVRLGGGRPPVLCPLCAEERKRELTRARVAAHRARRGKRV